MNYMFFSNSLYEGWEINVLHHLLWITSHVRLCGIYDGFAAFFIIQALYEERDEEKRLKIEAIFAA